MNRRVASKYYRADVLTEEGKAAMDSVMYSLSIPVRSFWRVREDNYELWVHKEDEGDWKHWSPLAWEMIESGHWDVIDEIEGVEDLKGLGPIERLRLQELVGELDKEE